MPIPLIPLFIAFAAGAGLGSSKTVRVKTKEAWTTTKETFLDFDLVKDLMGKYTPPEKKDEDLED